MKISVSDSETIKGEQAMNSTCEGPNVAHSCRWRLDRAVDDIIKHEFRCANSRWSAARMRLLVNKEGYIIMMNLDSGHMSGVTDHFQDP